MTNAECRANQTKLYEAIGKRVKTGTFQWLASGLAAVVLVLFAFTYNTGCTANQSLAKSESNTELFAAHYVAITAQIKEMKADITAMRKEIRDMTKLLYEREGAMLPPYGDPIGFAD